MASAFFLLGGEKNVGSLRGITRGIRYLREQDSDNIGSCKYKYIIFIDIICCGSNTLCCKFHLGLELRLVIC